MVLHNHGTIVGTVSAGHEFLGWGSAGNKIYNDGHIKGKVFLGDSDDVYQNNGGHAGKIYPEYGNDKLVAGPGTDKFVFNSTLNSAENVDRVKNFDSGTDKLFLDNAFFAALTGPGTLASGEFHRGSHAHDSNDYIIYDKLTGALSYDPDGDGNTFAQVEFAKLDKHLNLHASDFIVIA